MYNVLYTENARRDLEDIFSYIAQGSLDNALSFLDELKAHFDEVLSVLPNGGTLYHKIKGIRKQSYKGYTAFYYIPAEGVVEVLHVVHLGKPLSARSIEF